jgi:nucleoside-diphosphate-sugar epimerase
MVSPAADKYPEQTLYTNIGSTLGIIKAIKAQPDPDKVHFAYVGTVAMTGGRTEPIHWGRVGDPINPSIFDYHINRCKSKNLIRNKCSRYHA